jgi:hypothetical protein
MARILDYFSHTVLMMLFNQNPAFGAPQVRELTGIFIEKSIQVRPSVLL